MFVSSQSHDGQSVRSVAGVSTAQAKHGWPAVLLLLACMTSLFYSGGLEDHSDARAPRLDMLSISIP